MHLDAFVRVDAFVREDPNSRTLFPGDDMLRNLLSEQMPQPVVVVTKPSESFPERSLVTLMRMSGKPAAYLGLARRHRDHFGRSGIGHGDVGDSKPGVA